MGEFSKLGQVIGGDESAEEAPETSPGIININIKLIMGDAAKPPCDKPKPEKKGFAGAADKHVPKSEDKPDQEDEEDEGPQDERKR